MIFIYIILIIIFFIICNYCLHKKKNLYKEKFYNDMIVYKNNIYDIPYLNHYNKAIIFGKGPSFRSLKKQDKNTLFVCVNDSINYIEDADVLAMNDIVTYDKINKDRLKNLKMILTPVYPHDATQTPNKYISIDFVLDKFKDTYNGKIVFFNLKTSDPVDEYINLNTKITSANNAVEFILNYFINIKEIDFYGIGITDNNGYSDVFDNNKKQESLKLYNKKWISFIRKNIEKLCNKKNVNYNFN